MTPLTTSTDYVIRRARRAPGRRVAYEVVDMGGAIAWVTVPRALALPELADPIIRARLAARVRHHKVSA